MSSRRSLTPSTRRQSHERALLNKYVNGKLCARKMFGIKSCKSNRDNYRLWLILKQSQFKSELKLESVLQKPPHRHILDMVYNCHFPCVKPLMTGSETGSEVSYLTQRKKRTGLLLSGPKTSLQIKVNFTFHLEI
ncbi:hypothetical protein CHARACLAT_000283 [Characodon lateralis]|uniref:Uncharacterized protein n=1 Tax=Characodon lateralis TaxID=208331 RepID=A0ABU7DMI9_9TELE|nr:hypothetical protein [Characodon lateralis]